jgi:hypothetical protein
MEWTSTPYSEIAHERLILLPTAHLSYRSGHNTLERLSNARPIHSALWIDAWPGIPTSKPIRCLPSGSPPVNLDFRGQIPLHLPYMQNKPG